MAKPSGKAPVLAPGEARMIKTRKYGWCIRIQSDEDLTDKYVEVTMYGRDKQRVHLTKCRFPAKNGGAAVWEFKQGDKDD